MSDYVKRFIEAVYPDAPNLAMAAFNEEKVLTDAADKIASLRARLERARKGLQEIAKKEGRFSRDPFEHCQNCVEDMAKIAEDTLRELESDGGEQEPKP